MELMVKAPMPLLVSLTACAKLEDPVSVLNFRLVGASVTDGAEPIPVRLTTCVAFGASSEITTCPVCVPEAVGVNTMLIVHVPPAAIGLPLTQLSVSVYGPLGVTSLMCSGTVC